jgi:hypothetical protein
MPTTYADGYVDAMINSYKICYGGLDGNRITYCTHSGIGTMIPFLVICFVFTCCINILFCMKTQFTKSVLVHSKYKSGRLRRLTVPPDRSILIRITPEHDYDEDISATISNDTTSTIVAYGRKTTQVVMNIPIQGPCTLTVENTGDNSLHATYQRRHIISPLKYMIHYWLFASIVWYMIVGSFIVRHM